MAECDRALFITAAGPMGTSVCVSVCVTVCMVKFTQNNYTYGTFNLLDLEAAFKILCIMITA